MLKAYKYRIYPNKTQTILINKHIGACRFVFNLALETKNHAYASHKRKLSCFDLHNQLPDLKRECEWLKEIDSQALQQSIANLDKAFIQFFKGVAKFPNFKRKNKGAQSFRNPHGRWVKIENNKISIPKFTEGIKIIIDRAFKGEIKSTTISRTPTGKYFISILVDNKKTLPEKQPIKESKTIGIDLGLSHFIITSDGIKIDNPRYLRQAMGRLKISQRRASKKVKGSQNRKKANLRIALQHEKVTNKRMDFLHKLSTKLIRDNQTICVENLSVSNMLKNHKLAQAISDVSWSKFIELLKYKADWYGKNLIQINKFEPTTKTCNNCGFVNDNLTLKDRNWQCNICGIKHDRDVNAAINIKKAGLKITGQGMPDVPVELPTLVGTVKQENSIESRILPSAL